MVAGIRVVEDLHRDALDRLGALDGRDVHKALTRDRLQRPFDQLAAVAPGTARRIRKIVSAIGDELRLGAGDWRRPAHADKRERERHENRRMNHFLTVAQHSLKRQG
jgi:hypothetical protein